MGRRVWPVATPHASFRSHREDRAEPSLVRMRFERIVANTVRRRQLDPNMAMPKQFEQTRALYRLRRRAAVDTIMVDDDRHTCAGKNVEMLGQHGDRRDHLDMPAH